MAILPEVDRQKVWRGFMRYLSRQDVNDTISANVKQDIKDAVDDTDDWINANEAEFNVALPSQFRNNASSSQKALLFCAIALMRYDEGLLRRIFGEVD